MHLSKNVLMIQPPFITGVLPSYRLSLMKAILTKNSIASEILYANLILKRAINPELYEKLSLRFNYYKYIEFIFASSAFPNEVEKNNYYEKYLKSLNKDKVNHVLSVKSKVNAYLNTLSDIIEKKNPKITWINLDLDQLTASLSIAKIIKKAHPASIVVLGGERCAYFANEVFLKNLPYIDYIFIGEAEKNFLEFSKTILKNKTLNKKIIDCAPINNLNKFPFPDYSDFIIQMEKLWFSKDRYNITIEASRGCWSGSKNQCSFCFYNNKEIQYRQKSPSRIKKEIKYIVNRYKPKRIYFVDRIMPEEYPVKVFKNNKYFKEVNYIFYELKPSIKYEDLRLLKENGLKFIQSGIETLDDNLLAILNKTTTIIDNIRFLRDCKTLGLTPLWNMLINIPCEKKEDYHEILKIIPSLHHLSPPKEIRPVIIHKNSPFYDFYQKNKIKKLKPIKSYYSIFPDNLDIDNISFYQEGKYHKVLKNKEIRKTFLKTMTKWRKKWHTIGKNTPKLDHVIKNDNDHFIIDSRKKNQIKKVHLSLPYYSLLKKLNDPILKVELESYIKNNDLDLEFNKLMKLKYIFQNNDKYISLVCNL